MTMLKLGKDLILQYLGRRYVVGSAIPSFTIGRGADNDLVLNDPRVSTRHALIRFQGGVFLIADQSANGTFLSGRGRAVRRLQGEECRIGIRGLLSFGAPPGRSVRVEAQFWEELAD